MRYLRIEAGDDAFLDEAWQVKEAIREEDGFLRQTWEFFSRSYTENVCHLLVADEGDARAAGAAADGDGHREDGPGDEPREEPSGEPLAGFATVRDDGYVLFLGIDAPYRDRGLGRELLERIDDEHATLSCHTRAGNDEALGFYRHIGFGTERLIENYYQDGDAAYYLVKGEEPGTGLGERIANALRGDGD